MVQIILVGIMLPLIGVLLHERHISPTLAVDTKRTQMYSIFFTMLMAAGVLARLVGTALYNGHPADMACFSSWADTVYTKGFGGFYGSGGLTDYPPGYLYILWIFGAVKNIFAPGWQFFYALLKIPAIACDTICAVLLWKTAKKHMPQSAALSLAAVWIFNPAVFINSAVWGQVDSVFTLLVFLCLLMLAENKLCGSFFIFAAAVMVKPQSLFYTPVLIFAIIERAVYPEFNKKLLVKYIAAGFCAVGALFLLALPFGVGNVAKQYAATLASYPYCSVNAFNIWCALGMNWVKLTPLTAFIGNVVIIGVVAASAAVFFRCRGKEKYFLTPAFICCTMFILSTKMHERYCYPAMLFLLAAFAVRPKPCGFYAYSALTAAQFINTAFVLFYYDNNTYYQSTQPAWMQGLSFISLAAFAAFILTVKKYCTEKDPLPQVKKKTAKSELRTKKPVSKSCIRRSGEHFKITKTDVGIILIVSLLYSAIALYNLGDTAAPQNGVALDNSAVSFTVDNDTAAIDKLMLYVGPYHINSDNKLTVTCADADGETVFSKSFEKGSVFHWESYALGGVSFKTVTLSASGRMELFEAGVIGTDGRIYTCAGADGLFDEQRLVPERTTHKNGTYFDEIYHARTAYEFIHKLHVYEWTHPPLGKWFISLGIRAFGMTPFGWRIAGTLFGILMLPALYIFAKKLFGKTSLAAFCMTIFALDFMHFAQTRIATIDVYITFFIILMYMFMMIYCRMSFFDTNFKRTLVPLGLCGICFGLGTASKWTGMYAGAGLAVIFFISLYLRYREYEYACRYPKGESDGISHAHIIEVFPKYLKNTLLFCVVFFVIIPILIYLASYLPYMSSNGTGLAGVIKNQSEMFNYHKNIEAEHDFASRWYEWAVMRRPIWYYSGAVSDTVKEGISSFGNPIVWWMGIPALLYTLYCAAVKRDKTAAFLGIGYLAQLIPWVGVTRITFIYHYFPCVPFLTLMLTYSAANLIREDKKRIIAMAVFVAAAAVLFAMFYPVLSGYPVSVSYVKSFLKWFDSWYFVSGA